MLINFPFLRLCRIAVGIVAFAGITCAQASISLNATRVVFDGRQKEASVVVRNGGSNVLIQSWIESHTLNDEGDLPFAVTPPLAKMQANGQQLLRILYAGGASSLPQDKESVLWLSVQEIPEAAREGDAVLQVAVRQRIKLFFRPAGLRGNAQDAPAALQWRVLQVDGKPTLQLLNPGVFHVSINSIVVGTGESLTPPMMIAPGESRSFALKPGSPDRAAALRFSSVNDYGGVDVFETRLDGAVPVRAVPSH